MKNITTFEDFVNEEYSINEGFSNSEKGMLEPVIDDIQGYFGDRIDFEEFQEMDDDEKEEEIDGALDAMSDRYMDDKKLSKLINKKRKDFVKFLIGYLGESSNEAQLDLDFGGNELDGIATMFMELNPKRKGSRYTYRRGTGYLTLDIHRNRIYRAEFAEDRTYDFIKHMEEKGFGPNIYGTLKSLSNSSRYKGYDTLLTFESVNEAKEVEVTQEMWDTEWKIKKTYGKEFDENMAKRVEACMSVARNEEQAEEWAYKNWKQLPTIAKTMTLEESKSEDVNEGMSKSAIKKLIKTIDYQIDNEEGGDGEPLTDETLQALEREKNRLEKLMESVDEGNSYKDLERFIKIDIESGDSKSEIIDKWASEYPSNRLNHWLKQHYDRIRKESVNEVKKEKSLKDSTQKELELYAINLKADIAENGESKNKEFFKKELAGVKRELEIRKLNESRIPNIPTKFWETTTHKSEDGTWSVAKFKGKYYGGYAEIEPGSVNDIWDIHNVEVIDKKEYDEADV
jgi:hypothetical protein